MPAHGVGIAVSLALDAALTSGPRPAAFRVWQITSRGARPGTGDRRRMALMSTILSTILRHSKISGAAGCWRRRTFELIRRPYHAGAGHSAASGSQVVPTSRARRLMTPPPARRRLEPNWPDGFRSFGSAGEGWRRGGS